MSYVTQNGSETFCIELPLAHKRIETPVFVLKLLQRQTETKVNAVNILIVFSIAVVRCTSFFISYVMLVNCIYNYIVYLPVQYCF
jgi:hypothetical protein